MTDDGTISDDGFAEAAAAQAVIWKDALELLGRDWDGVESDYYEPDSETPA